MECSRCKATIPEGSKFCIECGSSIYAACPTCQNINPPQAKFCGKCGSGLLIDTTTRCASSSSSTLTKSGLTKLSAERRQVTVMFCDLVGSTALATRLDPEDLRDVIGAYHRCVAATVASWDGFVAKYMGDGVLIYFGYPQAHEDDAERAVQAALAIIRAIKDVEAPDRLEVRVGVATGLVVVGDLIGENESQERGIVGETPNLAARLQTLADSGTVVIEPSTRILVGELFDYRDLGEAPLKGFSGPVRTYEVIGTSAVESRFEAFHSAALAPLVGRDEEIELLLRRWIKAKAGEGQVVLISGEPGIGKSRLAATIIERIGQQPNTRLRYFCSPHHTDSAFHPIIRQIERAAQLQRDDDAREKVNKLDALLSQGSAQPDDYRLIGDLLSLPDVGRNAALHLSPQQRRQRTSDALIRQLEGLAQHQPVLQIFEDVHWADPTSLDLLNRNIEQIQKVPVLLLMTFRPEFKPPWVGEPHVSVMTLGRLGQRNGAALIQAIAGDRIPPETVGEIIDRTDGVPLFVEELTKAVLEAGIDGPAAASALSMVPSRSVPASLHASLMARLDRLGSGKELAQIGAAIGREFSYELLLAVSSHSEAALRAGVKQITASGLVLCRGTPPESSYLFKHALVQDAAYGTLLRRTRQQLHARIAEVLETQFFDQAEREPEVLGRHFSEAQRHDRAAGYWLKAGRQAAERSANLEAIRHLSRALESLKILPDSPERDRQELIVQSAIGTPLTAVHGYAAPETGIAFSRARELGARLGDAHALFSTLSGQWTFHCVRGDHEKLRELTAETQRRAREMQDEMLELAGYRLSGLTALYFGEFEQAKSDFETILRVYVTSRHRPPPVHYIWDPKFYAIAYLPVLYWVLGFPNRARTWQQAALEYAAELNQAALNTHIKIYAGAGLDELLFNVASVRSYADAIVDLADQHDLRYFRLSGLILQGWTVSRAGDGKVGLALMRRSATERLAMGVSWFQIRYLIMLAESYLRQGRIDEGLVAIAEAKDLRARTQEHMWAAELSRIEGELRRNQGTAPVEVEMLFQSALGIARDQKAKSFELRAAISLARLWRDQGRLTEAKDLLAPIYGWLGVDSPDVVDAKMLLQDL